METRTAVLVSALTLFALCCAVYIVARLRTLSAQRADAAVRAAATLAELHLVTKELKARQENEPPEDAGLSPGDRLLKRYPGTSTAARFE
jgi:sensor histidine kinase regulating citrate/malate metabolism